MDTPDERRAKARARMRKRRARETPAEAAERRRRNRERMRMRRRAAVPAVPEAPAVPVRQSDPRTLLKPVPRLLAIDPRTLKVVSIEESDIVRRMRGG